MQKTNGLQSSRSSTENRHPSERSGTPKVTRHRSMDKRRKSSLTPELFVLQPRDSSLANKQESSIWFEVRTQRSSPISQLLLLDTTTIRSYIESIGKICPLGSLSDGLAPVFFDAPHQKGCLQPPSNSASNPEFSVSFFLGLFNDQSQANHLSLALITISSPCIDIMYLAASELI